MPEVDWSIFGPTFMNCNCAWGCPCQFSALPTDGTCEAVYGMRIEKGHFDDIRLDGIRWAGTFKWPGAIHDGNGTCQFYIDESTDEAQRSAISDILHGRYTDEKATVFQVYACTMTTVLEPRFVPIEFEADVEACTAKLVIPGIIESIGMPIISPFSGKPHRVRVALRSGVGYTEAEYGSGTSKTTGDIKLEFTDSYGQLAYFHLNQNGPVR